MMSAMTHGMAPAFHHPSVDCDHQSWDPSLALSFR